ncbi:MAG: hypothetical protein KME46_00380 [Brasilonema angustatum HA4187-MV1]|nr:hypothetical protein [Brasilonema angustatum HA4187-MV1]
MPNLYFDPLFLGVLVTLCPNKADIRLISLFQEVIISSNAYTVVKQCKDFKLLVATSP